MAKTTETPKNPKRQAAGTLVNELQKSGAQALVATVHEVVQQPKKRGPKGKFTREKWERILETIATYGDLIEVCSEPDMPAIGTLYTWIRENPALKDEIRGAWEMFSMVGHSVNNNILRGGILSTGDRQRDVELAANNRWHMSKTNRRDFGDKTQIDVTHHEPVYIDIGAIQGQIVKPDEPSAD